jgi:hypothetical protein
MAEKKKIGILGTNAFTQRIASSIRSQMEFVKLLRMLPKALRGKSGPVPEA